MRPNRHAAQLAFALCLITTAVNLQAPLYASYAQMGGYGVAATTVAFSFYVIGILPVLLALGGVPDRIGPKRTILLALALSMGATALMLASPHLPSLAAARWMLGTGTALMSAAAPAYMAELLNGDDTRRSTNWVTASTSVGFGLGAALTSICLLAHFSLRPPSFWLHLTLAAAAAALLMKLPDSEPPAARSAMLRLPYYPPGSLPFGFSILLAWATVGLVIAVLPATLAAHHLAQWSGFSTFAVISCGVLFQPLARRMHFAQATGLGLTILPLAYALLAWGASTGSLAAVLAGAVAASSACYGLVYLGGLGAVVALGGEHKTRACSGFFLLAYVGFSLPVVGTGMVADHFGRPTALLAFGALLLAGSMIVVRHLNLIDKQALSVLTAGLQARGASR